MSCYQLPKRNPICALVVLFAALCGCNSGGSSSSTITQASSVRVDALTVTPVADGTEVEFELVSADGRPASVSLAYSEDRGLEFFPATIDGEYEELEASADGVTHTVLWPHDSDLGTLPQGDLMLRLTPREANSTNTGPHSYSGVFALGNNTAPQLHSVTTPTDTQGGEVLVTYSVSDEQADRIELQLEFSIDNGANWAPATAAATGDGIDAIPTSASPVIHTVSWFPQVDVVNPVTSAAMLRLTARDVEDGNTLTTGSFGLNLLAPQLTLLTVGDIPKEMNGSIDYTNDSGGNVDFHVRVPTSGFQLTVRYAPTPGGQLIDPTTLSVTCNRPVGALPIGAELGAEFDAGETTARWTLPPDLSLPTGWATFTARVRDVIGNWSNAMEFEVEVINASGFDRPFDQVDRWYLDFSRDQFSISSAGTNTITISSALGGNGQPDFQEDLEIIGLRSPDPLDPSAAINTNSRIQVEIQDAIIRHLNTLYGGNPDGTGMFSPNLQFTASPGGHTSTIRVGGDDSVPGYTLGRAHFDHRNAVGNNNTASNLGCFTTNFIGYYINSSSLFRSRFDPLIRGRGTPVGEDIDDAIVLHPNFVRISSANTPAQNDRYDDIFIAIDALGRAVGVILAHEVGHSIGLCSNGPPPSGLFGGVRGPNWSGGFTNSFHFDSPGTNIMAAALSFSGSITQGSNGYKFNEVNSAYLSEMILLQ
ncbi:MAG: hypothetical protein AAF581_15350 [Planctomycetota bacterium]